MTKNVLITGGCGFLGHHVVEHILKNTDWNITILDRLSYAAVGMQRLRHIKCMDWRRLKVFKIDFTHRIEGIRYADYILHLGAETHVDNSIKDPIKFVETNVIGTVRVLEWAREFIPEKIIYMSTDEVFGPAPVGVNYKEWDRYNCTNPYSASKAGAEELCLAYANTYGLPVTVVHGMNIFGERQHPEKFIPLVIGKVLAGETVQIHANKNKTKAGSRFWIHARNVASALLFLLEKGLAREKYNVVGEVEVDNLAMAQMIANVLGVRLDYELVDFHSSRPGHDLRYALDGTKMRDMGWNPPKNFEESLRKVVEWTVAPENTEWFRGSYASAAY